MTEKDQYHQKLPSYFERYDAVCQDLVPLTAAEEVPTLLESINDLCGKLLPSGIRYPPIKYPYSIVAVSSDQDLVIYRGETAPLYWSKPMDEMQKLLFKGLTLSSDPLREAGKYSAQQHKQMLEQLLDCLCPSD
jgi:hypothetical protein